MKAKLFCLYCSLFSGALLSAQSYAIERGPIPSVNSDSKFVVYYGDDYYTNTETSQENWILNESVISALSSFDVVVLQPNQPHCTPEVVDELKLRGVDVVLGYISIGEDYIDNALESPLENGSGMVAYDAATNTLKPVSGNTLQSFYIDVDSQTLTYDSNGSVIKVETTARRTPDGIPDYNPNFLGYMVNPDSNWRWVIDNMRIGTSDVNGRSYKAGLKQLAGPRAINDLRGRSGSFGFDGFFLDTIDTAGPYDGIGWYPWVISEMRNTVKYISDQYPDKLLLANRGAFFFSAGVKSPVTDEYPIDYSIRPYINGFLFESFRYDSDPTIDGDGGITEYYNENRYNVAPKVIAEANRSDGFTLFSLDYESGRSGIVDDGFNTAIRTLGYTAYLAKDRSLDSIYNAYASKLPEQSQDNQPPSWDASGHTIYNEANTNMRIGTQTVSKGNSDDSAFVTWDIAIDQSYPLSYEIIVTDLSDQTATHYKDISYETNPDWLHNPESHAANRFEISGLQANREYNIKVYAKDALGNINNDDQGITYSFSKELSNPILRNQITLDGLLDEWSSLTGYTPDPNDIIEVSDASHLSGAGNQANWRQITLAHTTDTNELFMAYTNETNIYVSWGFQVFIDSDDDKNTGFKGSFANISNFPIGADFLIEGVHVYQYAGEGTDWAWLESSASNGYEVGRIWSGKTGEVFLPMSWIGNPSSAFNFVVFGNNDFYVDGDTPVEYDWYPDSAAQGGYFRYNPNPASN